LNWTILFKCLEMTIVVIWRYINKTELNWIELKSALVRSVFKSDITEKATNYIPINLFPVLPKVLGRVVSEQLSHYFDTNHYLHPLQFNFRHNHSTGSAACSLLENIKQLLDKGNIAGAVFLDLLKYRKSEYLIVKFVSNQFNLNSHYHKLTNS